LVLFPFNGIEIVVETREETVKKNKWEILTFFESDDADMKFRYNK